MRTLFKIGWLNLKRDRVSLALSFVLPIVFFTLMALALGGRGGTAAPSPFAVAVVDLDTSDVSRRFVAALDRQEALAVMTRPRASDEVANPEPLTLADARQRVRAGEFPVAVVIPMGFGQAFGDFAADAAPVELIYDAAEPIALYTTRGLLQAAAMQAAPDRLMSRGLELLETHGGPLTPEQRQAAAAARSFFADESNAAGDSPSAGSAIGLIEVEASDVRADDTAEEPRRRSMAAYLAAGIGVMFLLFSMTGAGGALLEEEEAGVLERLLGSDLSMTRLLAGKWLFFVLTGTVQVMVMFVWGDALYGLDLWSPRRLAGVVLMSVVTAMAAAAFGLVLAAACRTRSQLSGLSTLVILTMSALGGSMVPRFAMPEFMQTVSLFTLNGWALDGFLKVFWYDDPAAGLWSALWSLAPQVAVLSALTAVLLVTARTLARRWQVL